MFYSPLQDDKCEVTNLAASTKNTFSQARDVALWVECLPGMHKPTLERDKSRMGVGPCLQA